MPRSFNRAWLSLIADALGRGESRASVVAELRDDHDVPTKVARRHVQEVVRSWGERLLGSPDDARAELLGMAMSVYAECRRAGHTKTALTAIETMARLAGLTRTEALVAIGVVDSALPSSPDAIRARVAELRQRALEAGKADGDAS